MSESKKFNIELRFSGQTGEQNIRALAQELSARGHNVSIKSAASRLPNVGDIARSASNLKEIAESGVQMLRDVIAPIVAKAADVKQSDAQTAQNTKDGAGQNETGQNAGSPFENIGPQTSSAPDAQKQSGADAGNSAVVVDSQACLGDAKWDDMRIGLIAENGLREDWLPAKLDAIVIPHPAFRPYLESVNWPSDRIFEGGFPARPEIIPRLSHQDALANFKIDPAQGRVVIVMASGFRTSELQTLLTQISLLPKNLQIFFYHASDNAKSAAIAEIARRSGLQARAFGNFEGLANCFAMADLIIANAVDAELNALAAVGVPLVISAQNIQSPVADFLVHEDAAQCVNRIYNIASATNRILADSQTLDLMKAAAAGLAQRASVPLCADAVEAALAAKDAIVGRPDRQTADAIFEYIGAPALIQNPFARPEQSAQAAPCPAQNFFSDQTAAQSGRCAPIAPIAAPQNAAPAGIITPTLSFSSKKELEKEYTKLIQTERAVEKALDAASNAVNNWELRLDLAKQNMRDDLIASAADRLNAAKNEEMNLMNQKQTIDAQKRAMRLAARNFGSVSPDISLPDGLLADPWQNDPLEDEFKRLQAQNALNNLRNKMK